MAANDFQGGNDPDLAALFGTAGSDAPPPDFNDIFGDNSKAGKAGEKKSDEGSGVDLSV
jgi:hypothetical protein